MRAPVAKKIPQLGPFVNLPRTASARLAVQDACRFGQQDHAQDSRQYAVEAAARTAADRRTTGAIMNAPAWEHYLACEGLPSLIRQGKILPRVEIRHVFTYNGQMPSTHEVRKPFIAGRHLYVFLFALYPILLLYHQNLSEATFGRMLYPMLFALAFAAVLWLGLRFLFADRERRAVAIFIILLLVFYYKLIHDVIAGGLEPLLRLTAPLFSHILLLASMAAGLFLINRSKRSFIDANRILGTITCVLMVWSLGAIVLHHARDASGRDASLLLQKSEFQQPVTTTGKPDIYCIFLDEFASLESMKNLFHYDNSPFAERLRSSGFFIAERSRSLHILTSHAMASVLNMERTPPHSNATLRVQQNKVACFLSENGYTIYDFPYRNFAVQKLARKHFSYPLTSESIFFDDFYKALFDMSALYPLSENWQKDEDQYLSYSRKQVLYVFEQIPAVVKKPGPKFVLIHLYTPHAPFLFDKNGGSVPPEHSLDYSQRKYYLEQYQYISRRAAEMVEDILKGSTVPPVIILQSDHGYRGSFRKPLHHVVPQEEKHKIFLAMHMPGYDHSRLDAALSPVNVFRIILNHYFGQRLPLLQDPGGL